MNIILSINANPETFNSDLPEGINGDVAAIDLITVDNVKEITAEQFGEYEENIDGEFIVELNNGDWICIDGYCGMWEVIHYHSLNDQARAQLIENFREWMKDIVQRMTS